MCLQWCHVRRFLIDNDLPCSLWCSDEIRLGRAAETCDSCCHRRLGMCAMTSERIPLAHWCCHYNAAPQNGPVTLWLGETVPLELARAYGAFSSREIFEMSESAPELEGAPQEGIVWRIEEMSKPLVYGVRAACWDFALTGAKSIWCGEDEYADIERCRALHDAKKNKEEGMNGAGFLNVEMFP